jgi:monoamine oxidase
MTAAGYPTTYQSHTAAGVALDQMSVFDWIELRVSGGHTTPMGQLLDVAYNIEYGNVSTVQSSLNLIYLLGFQPALLHELPGIHGGRRRRRRARGERDPERLQGGNLSLGLS